MSIRSPNFNLEASRHSGKTPTRHYGILREANARYDKLPSLELLQALAAVCLRVPA